MCDWQNKSKNHPKNQQYNERERGKKTLRCKNFANFYAVPWIIGPGQVKVYFLRYLALQKPLEKWSYADLRQGCTAPDRHPTPQERCEFWHTCILYPRLQNKIQPLSQSHISKNKVSVGHYQSSVLPHWCLWSCSPYKAELETTTKTTLNLYHTLSK